MIIDLFAGIRGWEDLTPELGGAVGIDVDRDACRSAVLAGYATIRADVATFPLERIRNLDGLIASPPCPDFSTAGNRAGIDGDTGRFIAQVPRWVRALRPRWVACEQVPLALEWWERFAHEFAELGYSTWCGVLDAADYGVPQRRERALLLASRDLPTIRPPAPTHSRCAAPVLFGTELAPWVSMADALGWGYPDRPSPCVTAGGTKSGGAEPFANTYQRRELAALWRVDRRHTGKSVSRVKGGDEPAPTITAAAFGRGVWKITDPAGARVRITPGEALTLQGFRQRELAGSQNAQFRQIGNAIPPPLARAALQAIIPELIAARACA